MKGRSGEIKVAARGLSRKRSSILIFPALLVLGLSAPAVAAGQSKVVATVGTHEITQAEVDTKLKPEILGWENRLYQLRRLAIRSIADEYLVDAEAKKAHLSPQDYLRRQLTVSVSDGDAEKYYAQHKSEFALPFDKVKPEIVARLHRQRQREQQDAMLGRLRREHDLKVLIEPLRLKFATAGHQAIGPADAPVTVAEFADYQCPYCQRAESTLRQLRSEYGDKMRLVFFDYPLTQIHPRAMQAAEATRCAAEQDKFWPYHDKLFAEQSKLAPNDLKAAAAQVGLDEKKFSQCLATAKYQAAIRQDLNVGRQLGVEGTPGFFINGRPLSGAEPEGVFESVINEELAKTDHPGATASAAREKGESAH